MKEPYGDLNALGPEFVDAVRRHMQAGTGNKSRRLYLSLYEVLASGRLSDDVRLPASRDLAGALGLGRNTVTAAYQQLVDEGLLYTAQRGGTRVRGGLPVRQRHTSGCSAGVPCRAQLSARGASAALSERPKALCPGEPDAALFPRSAWSRALAQSARERDLQLGYRYDAGEPVLQAAIARYLANWRSLVVEPEQILITAATRQSLAVAAGLYADPGDTAWVESPGYSGASQAWRLFGLQLRPLAVDQYGLICPDELAPARLLYTTPCFQYPIGPGLAPSRRVQLLSAAAKAGTVVFEDDYDSEFRSDSQPRPALASDAAEVGATVLHAGTFSKLMFPGVRLGWLVVPAAHRASAVGLLRSIGGGHNAVQQRAVAALLDNGTVARHLVRARVAYGRRREVLMSALHGGPLRVRESSGGLSLVLDLREPLPRRALSAALTHAGIGAQPLEELRLEAPDDALCSALVVGTGNVEEAALPAVVARLHAVCEAVSSG